MILDFDDHYICLIELNVLLGLSREISSPGLFTHDVGCQRNILNELFLPFYPKRSLNCLQDGCSQMSFAGGRCVTWAMQGPVLQLWVTQNFSPPGLRSKIQINTQDQPLSLQPSEV